MWQEITQSIHAYFQAFRYINKHRLWNYLFISGILSFIICLLIFGAAYYSSDNIADYLIEFYPFDWGRSVFQKAGQWLVLLLLLIACLFFLKYVIIIALGPLLSKLSERIESIELSGFSSSAFTLKNLFVDIWRGIKINVRNIFKELWYTFLLVLLGLIPVLNILSGPSIFLVQSFYAGFGNYDLYLERHLSYKESIQFLRKRRVGATTNGLLFLGLLAIPVIGWILAPFLSVVAASLMLSKDSFLQQQKL